MSVVLLLQPMPEIEQNGPDFKYVVSYERIDVENAIEHVAVIQNPEAWHYVVPDTNLEIYKPYRITAKANNARGDSMADLTVVIGHSGEDGNISDHCSQCPSVLVRLYLLLCRYICAYSELFTDAVTMCHSSV